MVPQPKITPKPATASTMSDSIDSMPKTADGKAFIRVPRRLLNRDDVYLKKMGTLSKMCANVEQENNKFRYHIYCVRKEIERLSMIKRGLCQRLIEHGDRDFMDTQIEYLDTSWQDEKFEHIFEDVLGTSAAPDAPSTSTVAPRVIKKAKFEKKKPKDLPPVEETPDARETIERILHAASSEIQLREKSNKARRRDGPEH
uniref:INO80 complex subunit F domain-containing protein n=1 Tax=Panagrellus redivivus TaxID=6233 RepID=A0A7E4V3B4_PANRE